MWHIIYFQSNHHFEKYDPEMSILEPHISMSGLLVWLSQSIVFMLSMYFVCLPTVTIRVLHVHAQIVLRGSEAHGPHGGAQLVFCDVAIVIFVK